MIKVQKRSKEIFLNNPCDIRGSTVILRSYENTFVLKENKNNDFIQQFRLLHVTL